MNTRIILPALLIAASPWLANPATAAVPPVDGKGTAGITACPTTTLNVPSVYHFDKIVFTILNKLPAATATDQQALSALPLNTELDIKVIDNPKTVADLKSKVLTFLGAVVNADTRPLIRIVSVTYAVVTCPKVP
jgi:hypothetical protein